ncbi:uncharacterized protein LOC129777074 [Toxorhynchites rutilus septentrionalis]|uniref:uncharacterized protein LOC129777074 n=1 Tax=Toxorhynchites rutilus septentrionalis TaxID=329112 RepID=UPI00247A718B|nr:uncharacterized protein LOC129777074 [Toxorhynchites rutilus septentrionalis]
MRRSTPPYPVVASGSGQGEVYEQDPVDVNHQIRQLKRKHSEEEYPSYSYQEQGHKIRKDSQQLQLEDVNQFQIYGQAFHGSAADYQITDSDGNNNQNRIHQEQQQLSYIYDVSSGGSGAVVPVPHSQIISQDIPTSSNGIVLTDISSSTWTSTQELLDLDRKAALTVETDSHNSFPITSTNHHQQQPPQSLQHIHQTHFHGQHQPLQHHQHQHHHHPPYGNNHLPKTQELTIVTSGSGRTPPVNGSMGSAPRRVTPAPTPDTPEDIEDKNLSWLFNFKLDDLPHLSPEAKRKQGPSKNASNGGSSVGSTSHSVVGLPETDQSRDRPEQSQSVATAAAIEDDDMNVAEIITIENSNTTKVTKKPPFTYTELIEYALEDKGELTVSGIYQWISDHFPFYKSNDDRWKNSVRHNLSINPHFRKGNKAPQGAGHLWTISSRDSEANFLAWEHKRQRLELFFKMEAANAKGQREPPAGSPTPEEIAAATASLAQYEPHSPSHGSLNDSLEFQSPQAGSSSQHFQQQPSQQQQQHEPLYTTIQSNQFDAVQGDELKRSAGEILNGIRRNVEVQIVHPINSNNFQAYALLDSDYYLADYLNPVSKEEIVQECGLRSAAGHRAEAAPSADYYITTIDPIELGINMSSGQDEDQILFEDDFNLNYFGNNIMT